MMFGRTYSLNRLALDKAKNYVMWLQICALQNGMHFRRIQVVIEHSYISLGRDLHTMPLIYVTCRGNDDIESNIVTIGCQKFSQSSKFQTTLYLRS